MNIVEDVHSEGTRRFFFVEIDGKRLGEIALKKVREGVWNIDHTQVDESLKGQGVARKLLDAAVAWGRKGGAKFTATCPYAKAQFEKNHAEFADVLSA